MDLRKAVYLAVLCRFGSVRFTMVGLVSVIAQFPLWDGDLELGSVRLLETNRTLPHGLLNH